MYNLKYLKLSGLFLLALIGLATACVDELEVPETTQTVADKKAKDNEHAGSLMFKQITQLPPAWWHNPETVWDTWDKSTLYLWGANLGNYKINDPKQSLGGSGMASANGPTRGQGHPNYVGIVTTTISKTENDDVFNTLKAELKSGKNVTVPTLKVS